MPCNGMGARGQNFPAFAAVGYGLWEPWGCVFGSDFLASINFFKFSMRSSLLG